MARHSGTCPLTQQQLIDEYFMEVRAKILDVAAFLEREPGADGVGHKLSQLLLGFLTLEVVPLANRLAELGIDPTPLLAATTGILRLYADTLEHRGFHR